MGVMYAAGTCMLVAIEVASTLGPGAPSTTLRVKLALAHMSASWKNGSTLTVSVDVTTNLFAVTELAASSRVLTAPAAILPAVIASAATVPAVTAFAAILPATTALAASFGVVIALSAIWVAAI